jgi:hypothetical protein
MVVRAVLAPGDAAEIAANGLVLTVRDLMGNLVDLAIPPGVLAAGARGFSAESKTLNLRNRVAVRQLGEKARLTLVSDGPGMTPPVDRVEIQIGLGHAVLTGNAVAR